jgi:cytochrome c oxidase assembly factor CtaG
VARWYWDGQYLFAMEVLSAAAVPLFVLSVPYVLWLDRYLVEPRDGAWHFGAMLIGREPYDAGG